MAKVTLSDISGGYNAPTKINANNAAVEAAIENTLSRDGTSPNQMEAEFDMNSHPIVNLGSPTSPTDAARLVDITGLITLTDAVVPSMTGNAGKVMGTDGSILVWETIDPAALPTFDTTNPGAVPATGASATLKALWGDGTWATPLAKASYAQTSTSNLWALGQRYTFVTVTYASSLVIDTSLGNTYKTTLTGNPTISFTNASTGRKFRLFLIQDGTGSRTVTWPTITWAGGDTEPTLLATPNSVTYVDLEYDGTTWFGSFDQSGTSGSVDPSDYDLAITSGDKYVDVFRRLGSPVSPATWEVLVSPGVVILSDSNAAEAIDFSGAFPSGTIINVLNQGYWLGRGGDGDNSAGGSDLDGANPHALAINSSKDGGNAMKGPASGVTVNITNANGYIWGGGGGGGRGSMATGNADDEGAVSGAGGGGAGLGRGGFGMTMRSDNSGTLLVTSPGGDGKLLLDGSSAGGAGSAGVESGAGSAEGADGGAGGTYGAAGSAGGTIVSTTGAVTPATTGGAAGRAITSGYAGTVNFVSGGTNPNVKGSI